MNKIRQTITLPAKPAHVYELLTDEILHEAFTGSPASIEISAGAAFSTYDGYINGQILELIPGRLIRQSWVAEEADWPDGHISEVLFQLSSAGGQTVLEFTHSNIPDGMTDRFKEGWEKFYWEPMRVFLSA